MALRVTLAGRVGVEVDGGDVAAGALGRPGRLALAYLVSERHRPVPRDELADVLWGDELPQSWDQMLRGVAHKLRGVLSGAGLDPNAALTTAGGAFALHLPPGVAVDVEEAAAALEAAEASLAAGYGGAARAQAAAARQVAARQFAPGLAGAWVERRQAELAELGLRATEALARAAVATADWATAITYAEEVIAAEAFRESAYLVLMDAHAGAGNRGEALRAYERCREVLVEELGVDPSPPTESAYLRLLGETPAPAEATTALPLPAALAPVAGAFIVGRRGEAEALDAALKRAGVDGRQGVLVGGEPGAGKTTLVAAAARRAHAGGARVLYGRADEELGLAYGPFAQALGHYVATAPVAELKAHVAVHRGVLARLVPELARRLPEATPPPATDAEADRWALFEAVTDALARAAAQSTVVVVLDDLHWAGAPTLALLRHLLAEPGHAALLILGTFRTTEPTPALTATLADLRRAPTVERITLAGLDAEEVAAFVEASGAGDDDPAALVRALHAHTAGNPFFVGQMLRHLAETGGTYRRQGPWSYYADAEGLEVPEGVVEVVRRRLGRLSADANRALVLAAVAGAEFDLNVIEGADQTEAATILDGLEEAASAALVVELDRLGRYRFAHALVRDAIYGGLSAARKARLHLRVAEAMEALPGDDAERLSALAHHFAEAAPAGAGAKAADYALAAGEEAMRRAAWDQATADLTRGVDAVRPDDPTGFGRRGELLVALAEINSMTARNDMSAVRDLCLRAAADARLARSPELLARAAATYNQPRDGDGEVGRRLCEEALAALGDGDAGLRARLLVGLVQSRPAQSPAGDAEIAEDARLSAEAVELARRSGDPDALWAALRLRCTTLMASPAAADLLASADELAALPLGRYVKKWAGVRFRAVACLRLGDRVGFEDAAEELADVGRQTHVWLFEDAVRRWRVTRALLDGRWADAEELAVAALGGLEPGAADQSFVVQMGLVRREQGRFPEFAQWLRTSTNGLAKGVAARAMLVLSDAESGHGKRAGDGLARMVGDLARIPQVVRPAVLALLSEVPPELLTPDVAAALSAALAPYSGTAIDFPMATACLGSADRGLGALAGALGRPDDAEDHFGLAMALETGLASPALLAHTQLAYARLLSTRPGQQQGGAAAQLLAAASATADALGMVGLSDQARQLGGGR